MNKREEERLLEEGRQEAIRSIERSIKLMDSLKKTIETQELDTAIRSIFASNCIHRYINDHLIKDTKALMDELTLKAMEYENRKKTAH